MLDLAGLELAVRVGIVARELHPADLLHVQAVARHLRGLIVNRERRLGGVSAVEFRELPVQFPTCLAVLEIFPVGRLDGLQGDSDHLGRIVLQPLRRAVVPAHDGEYMAEGIVPEVRLDAELVFILEFPHHVVPDEPAGSGGAMEQLVPPA